MTFKVCSTCGSEDVWKDANATWDIQTQQWVLKDIFDCDFCESCGGDTTIIDKEETP